MATMEAEIVCDVDKVEPITAKLLELGLAIEEIIDWVAFSDRSTIVALMATDLEPLAFFQQIRAIVDPFETSPGAAFLMQVEAVDRPNPRVPLRRPGWT